MKIIVVGCGKIGTTIIDSLINEGHDVTAVDSNQQILSDTCNIYDVMGVCGSGTDCNTLLEAGAERADLFVAATGSDEFNMLSCFLAKKMGAKNTASRIRNPEYNDQSLGFLRQNLDISLSINPERLMAHEIFNILKFPSAVKIETFSHRSYEMVEFFLKEASPFCDMSLMEIRKKFDAKFLVCAVSRKDSVYIPSGDFILRAGDRVGIISSPSELYKLFKMLVPEQKQLKNIMLAGASRTTYYLAKMLTAAGNHTKILDREKARCEEICEAVPKAVVICGDPADSDILIEEGIDNTDAFVALTGFDEENILLSFTAANHNVQKVISKVNREAFASVAAKLGLDCMLSPKQLVSNVIVRYARALENSIESSQVETLYKLMDGKAELLEFIIKSDNEATNIPLKDLNLKSNVLVCGIVRNRKPIIPNGDDIIKAGDHVIVLTSGHRMNDVTDILNLR